MHSVTLENIPSLLSAVLNVPGSGFESCTPALYTSPCKIRWLGLSISAVLEFVAIIIAIGIGHAFVHGEQGAVAP